MLSTHRLRGEILSQSRVRIVICAFMGTYYSLFGMPNHPVYLAFALYSVALLLIAERASNLSMATPTLTLLCDSCFAVCGLHVSGERGAFLLFFLIHFAFAYGIRFGKSYLIFSIAISCAGVTWLYWNSFPWRGHIHFLLSFLFGMPFISSYFYVLTEKLRKSEENANINATQSKQLLTFLAHDIRVPLHQLLIEIKNLQGTAFFAPSMSSLSQMESIVNLMARMCSGVIITPSVGAGESVERSPDAAKSKSITLSKNILEISEIFRDQIESNGANLSYKFSCGVSAGVDANLSVVDRVLLNVISNASRHCSRGYVEIRTKFPSYGEKFLTIEIENFFENDSDILSAESTAGNLGNSIFYGASLGMNSIRAVTESVGGVFSFHALNDSCFLSTLDLPAVEFENQLETRTFHPVVVISSNEELITNCVQKLNAVANVYCFPSLESFTKNIGTLDNAVAAIFSEDLVISSNANTSMLDEILASHGLIIAVCSDPGMGDQILIHGSRIKIARESSVGTWIQAMQLSETLRLTKNIAFPRTNCGVRTLAEARILALDDNAVNLSLLSAGLQRYGLFFTSVSSLQAGMRELAKKNYDILILDWNVGISTAFEFLHFIQKSPYGSSIRILLLTAQDLDITKMGLPFVGNVKLVTKPADNADIFLAIRELWLDSSDLLLEGLKIEPRDLFFCDSYMGMAWTDDSIRTIDDLLGNFLSDVQVRIEELLAMGDAVPKADTLRARHALASMCYSVGAYSLGEVFKIHQDENRSELEAGSAEWNRRVAVSRDLLTLTTVHISIFRLSIRARRVS